jgi:hypothetical protein
MNEPAIPRSANTPCMPDGGSHNARTADRCRGTKSGSTPRQERAFGTRRPAGSGSPPEAQTSVLMEQRVVAFAMPGLASLPQLVPGRATVDGAEARVLAGGEPEPAFARPVRDP